MTKKPNRKRYKPTPRRSKRKHKTVNTRSIVIIISFISLIGFLLYGLHSLKNEVSNKKNLSYNKTLNSKIEGIDKSLYEIFFKLGITNKDILKENTHQENKDGLSWVIKKQTIKLSKPYNDKELREAFKPLNSENSAEVNIKTKAGSILLEIGIDGYSTHLIDFKYKKINKPPVKKVLKTKKSEKVNSPVLYNGKKPKISIIVDDIGIDKASIDQLINISNSFTFAILPNRIFTSYAAAKANNNNIDILLHQPMEPKTLSGYTADDAGEGVLLTGQTKEDIIEILDNNLLSIPNVVGVNNHMGSKFTENEELMMLILNHIKRKDLLFVDSITSPNSKGFVIAEEIGVKSAKRDIFLDDKQKGKNYVKKQLRKLVNKAQKNGYAVGICHTYPQTIEALREEIPIISKEVNITPINKLRN